MVTKVVGQLEWEDADLGSNDFVKLEEGSNEGRIFTKPYQFYTVWTEDASGKTRRIRSSGGAECPLVARGEDPKPRWYVGWLNRKTGKPSILEMGPQIFRGILGLKKKASWGDPRGYDLDIERNPKNSQPLYVVSPLPKSPLSPEEIDMIKEFTDKVDFMKMIEVPSPEEVREMLGINEPNSSSVDDNFEELSSDSTDDDDDDFDFGA